MVQLATRSSLGYSVAMERWLTQEEHRALFNIPLLGCNVFLTTPLRVE